MLSQQHFLNDWMCWRTQAQSEDFFFITSDLSAFLQSSSAWILEEIYYSYSSLDCPPQAESSLYNYRGLKGLDSKHIQVDTQDNSSGKSTDYVVIFRGVSLHLFLNASSCSPIFFSEVNFIPHTYVSVIWKQPVL